MEDSTPAVLTYERLGSRIYDRRDDGAAGGRPRRSVRFRPEVCLFAL